MQTSQHPLRLVLLTAPVATILPHSRNYENLVVGWRGGWAFSLLVHKAKETQAAPSCPMCALRSRPREPRRTATACPPRFFNSGYITRQSSIKYSRPVTTHLSTSSGCFCCSFFPKPNPKKHTANMGVTPMMGAAMPRYSPVMPCKESQKQKLCIDIPPPPLKQASSVSVCSSEASFLHLSAKESF